MPSALLPRLLLLASPLALGCTPRADPLPGSGPLPPGAAPSSTAPAGEIAQPGDEPMKECGPGFFLEVPGRTGGPYRVTHCYLPTEPGAECVARTAPSLRRRMGSQLHAVCVESGPQRKNTPTGVSECCYEFGAMGKGRPMLMSAAPRVARLRRETQAPAWG